MIEEIAARLGVRAERGRRFAELTSLRVGGAIDWVITPDTEEQAAAIVHELEKAGIGWRPLGSGSNVLADDADHHYVVLSLSDMKGEVHIDGERVSVSAGYSLPRLCIDVARAGLSGIEGLGGIPGTVGGALWMNAGAYQGAHGRCKEQATRDAATRFAFRRLLLQEPAREHCRHRQDHRRDGNERTAAWQCSRFTRTRELHRD
jgi:UDP-N-acetylmuramate dehydrogenase